MYIALLSALFCLPAGIFAQSGEDISGYWYYAEKKGVSVSKIYKEGGQYQAFCFTYTNAGVTQENDSGNPVQSKRSRSMRGVLFLFNLIPAEEKGEKIWERGLLYNPRDGNTYKVKAGLSHGGNTLNLRVSLDTLGVVGATLQWQRVTNLSDVALYEKETAALTPIHPLR